MKLTNHKLFSAGGWMGLLSIAVCLMGVLPGQAADAQAISTTTVQGTVYLANGQPGTGTLMVSWPSFTTASGQLVTADSTTVAIAPDGFVSVNLAANVGASPAGLYYTAVYYMSDGSTNTQFWVVPGGAQAALGQVQAQLMPATQAVQAVNKAYVDQAIAGLSESLLTASGGTLSGPLTLCCDPTQPMQAADKHYVDEQSALAVPLTGATMTGPLTSVELGALYQVDQFPGSDFGAKLGACLSGLSSTNGGTCDARNFTGTLAMGSNLTISTANATVLLPCATISTGNQIIVTAGTRNVSLRGCALRGASTASGSQGGTVFLYSGAKAMVQVGDPSYAADTQGFHLDNVAINITSSSSASAQGLTTYRTQEMDLENLYFLGNSNQTGMTLDGTGNYTGGTFLDDEFDGFQTAVNAIGHQISNPATTDWMNASMFVRLHIDCPASGGNPISGSYGINLQQGDGNTFTGGDIEGCSTALHLGANAQNNTIVGLRNENSTNQIVADAGSSYNSWMTGGTMFTGQLTDNGTRNSFLDTFHRSFNGLNGDWYGSQKDATLTNHYRLGIGAGNERGLLNEIQTDYGYRWLEGYSDATAGEQFYQIDDLLNNVNRLSIGQYNNGQSSTNNQTAINAAGTGAVVLNGSTNAGTGGVVIGSGGANESSVATISGAGNAQFNGSLQVGGASTLAESATIKNQADAEIDYVLQAGATASQKESLIYNDWNGSSQWYMVKNTTNDWALNSATGGLDSFKAYQSTNSGDTYIDASNASGVVRINYETGAGTGFKVYGGNSSTLYASFTGMTAIQFPGLAASSGHNCLQVDNSGYVTNTGTACGTGSTNGTVNAGTSGQIAYYNGSGTALSGTNTVSVSAGGTGASTASGALANLGGAAITGAAFTGPVSVSTTLSVANNASIGPRYDVTNSAFGAVGNGVTDDTAAIQAAFDTCYHGGVAPYGGVVEFPGPHSYIVSSTINAHNSCQIEGVVGSSTVANGPVRILWNGAPAGTVSTITAFSVTSGMATFIAANSLTAGQFVDIEGLTTTSGLQLNRTIAQISATGLSSTQFEIPVNNGNVASTSDSGKATTVNVLLALDSNARYEQSISNVEFALAPSATAGSLQVDVYFGSRVDTGTHVLNTWAEQATEYGYYFAGGGMNVDFDKGWRCDQAGLSCIYWRVSGGDSFGIANGTADNYSGAQMTPSGGLVMLDGAGCGGNTGITFTARNMLFEVNSTITSGEGIFTLYDCPSANQQFSLNLESMRESVAAASTAGFNFPAIVMSPPNDAILHLGMVNTAIFNGRLANTTRRFVGIPALVQDDMGGFSTESLLSYAPSYNSAGYIYDEPSPIQLIGDAEVSQLWQHKVKASALLYSDTAYAALPNGTTLYAGQILAPPAYWNGANGSRYALDVVYQTGTTGVLNGGNTTCTNSGFSGFATCSSATGLSVGQEMTLGSENFQIQYVDATNPAAVFVYSTSTYPKVTHTTPVTLSFTAPVLGSEIQLPTKSAGAPTTLAWSQGDFQQNSGAVANGICGWVNVAAGTPGTWAAIPCANSSGILVPAQIGTGTPGAGKYVDGGTGAWTTLPASPALQGTDAKVLTAGTVSGTGATLCTDSNGGATTSGCSSGSTAISPVIPASDVVCAHGGDTTVAALTISNITYSSPTYTFTVSGNAQSYGYTPGQTFQAQGTTGGTGNFNAQYTMGTVTSNTSFTATSGTATGTSYGSGGTASWVCNNSTDAISSVGGVNFASTLTLPSITTAVQYTLLTEVQVFSPGAVTYNGQKMTIGGSQASTGFGVSIPSGTSASAVDLSWYFKTYASGLASIAPVSGATNSTPTPKFANTSGGLVLNPAYNYFSATGLGSVNSTGGSITGGSLSGTGTVSLTAFNNGGSLATVTGTINTSGSWTGSTFVVTNTGYGLTAAPTSATCTSGTATCSGTVTFPAGTTVLGGAQGTAVRLTWFSAK
jgi:hypothetical protein